MLDRFHCAIALILLGSMTLPCGAQSIQAPPSMAPQTRDSKACSNDQRLRAGRDAPRPSVQDSQTLSEKLAQTEGVLCPPDIDPDIKAPTPQGGTTPVIPPPGSPGGDPTVRPK
jgi:hypothetical protein